MLQELHVRDLALIEEAWIEFGPGLTVLSGETGAGKTALIGAIKLLVGERADSTLVRAGASETVVEGRVQTDSDDIVARRRLTADGRSRCTLDGSMATVGEMAARLGPFFDLHGQHEHQALLHPARHVGYLDRYAGPSAQDVLAEYGVARASFTEVAERLRELETQMAEVEQKADYLRFVVEEIDKIAPEVDEDAELERRLPTLRHGEKLSTAADEAFGALRAEGGATDRVTSAIVPLESVSGLDPALDEIRERLAEVGTVLDDLGATVRDYGQGIEHDPSALNVVEARLAALATLKKKYGPELSDVMRVREENAERLAALQAGDEGLADARKAVDLAEARLRAAGKRLATLRVEVAPSFTDELAATVEDLALTGARFEVRLEDLPFGQWTADGPQRAEFLFSSATDQPTRPLVKIASGGELSRVMLALKGVLGKADQVPILVFDEVDAGIGGSAAVAVGRRLAELSSTHQVLVVTHLAQVAAFADAHLVVRKSEEDGSTKTVVRSVEGEERVTEIARMLSGGETEAGRAHAEELLGAARS